ncbi:unnamed protein product [Euphydryas editha]|uniref:THAP-type domain-containing protein n=1 Tax=Euphydryas editha TaxID=104508 RepID=A0AAU9TRV0_EUPED|nr:unnamed protein product [Euphydryas editha]
MGRCVAFGCEEIGSHKYPSNPTLRRKWERALRRANFKATDYSRLCSKHFKVTNFETISKETGINLQYQPCSLGTVHQVETFLLELNVWKEEMLSIASYLELTETDESVVENTAVVVTNDSTDQGYAHEVEISGIGDEKSDNVVHFTRFSVNQSTQTSAFCTIFVIENFMTDDKVHFYTGLENYDKFKLLLYI